MVRAVISTAAARSVVVLDTNVVLDWLVFRNPEGLALGAALASGRLRWIATAAMRAELAHVLARGALDAWAHDLSALWAAWDGCCAEVPAPLPAGPAERYRCTDPDDQKFIDLAVATGRCLLLSRDRAVLKLARRLRDAGIDVMTPGAWLAAAGTAADSGSLVQ
jgi:predicted nucleic acid-binding protein